MRNRTCCLAPLVLAVIVAVPAGARAAAGSVAPGAAPSISTGVPAEVPAQDVVRYGPAQIVQTAPFYLYADESRGPLEALKPGTIVTVLEIQGDWILVEYQDARHGVRQGYVKARFIRSQIVGGTPKPDAPATPPSKPGAATAVPTSPSASGATPAPESPRAGQVPAGSSKPPARAVPPKPAKAPWKGWNDRAFVMANAAYQSGSSSFTESFTFQQYVERATIKTDYPAKDGPGFDLAAGVRVWKALALGAGVTRTDRKTTGSVSGTIPHPFHFDAMRPVSGTAAITRTETAIHALVAGVVPVGRRVLVTLSAGPSYFSVSQALVESAPFTESYPYDTAALSSPILTTVSKSVVGFNAGVDLGFFLTRTVGVGAGVRYARGSVDLPLHGATIGTDAGGLQAVVGLRLRVPPAAPKKPAANPRGAVPRS